MLHIVATSLLAEEILCGPQRRSPAHNDK